LDLLPELVGEFLVFLVAPGGTEVLQLRLRDSDLAAQVIAEPPQELGEPPQFGRIDNSLRHANDLDESAIFAAKKRPAATTAQGHELLRSI
jgi:hypothetical protein